MATLKNTPNALGIKDAAKSKYWQSLLELLSLTLGDPLQASPRKTSVFYDVVTELNYVIDLSIKLTRETILLWLETYPISLKSNAIENWDNERLSDILSKLKPNEYRLDIISSLVRISIADGHYDDFHQSLIKKIILLWDIPTKTELDIKFICEGLLSEKTA